RGRERSQGAAQPGSCAVPWRIPVCELETGRERAHCGSNLCASPGFSGRKAATRHDYRFQPGLAPPHFQTESAGLPWHFERERGPRPSPTGSALHYLVTALSVKKALTVRCTFSALSTHLNIGGARCTHSLKMRDGTR